MTNKKAIRILKNIDFFLKSHTIESCEEEHTAIDLAIKALEEVEEWHKLKLICANEGIMVYKVGDNNE